MYNNTEHKGRQLDLEYDGIVTRKSFEISK